MAKFFSLIFQGKIFKGDKSVWMIYFLLCMISLVEVHSASSRLTFDSANHWGPMMGQAFFLAVGAFVVWTLHAIDYKLYMLFSVFILFISLILLGITSMGHGGGELNGTNRWMNIFGISFQPSEVAKLALIMTVAMILARFQAMKVIKSKNKEKVIVGAIRDKDWKAFAIISVISVIVCGLIFKDNISTAGMLAIVVIIMMFIGRVPRRYLIRGIGSLVALGAIYLAIFLTMPESVQKKMPLSKRIDTMVARVTRQATTNDSASSTQEIQFLLNDKNSQSTYAKVAVANSNFFGMGPGNSIQRDFLQHAESDFIYAIIIEELGILGATVVLSLYLFLLLRCFKIAQKCQKFFPAYLVLGFGIMMMLQSMVNMGVAVGLLPVTGQTLPLISKGGSSILITSCYFGIILSVSRYAEKASRPQPQMEQNTTTEYTFAPVTESTLS